MNVPPILEFLQELVDNAELQTEFAREVMGKNPDEAAEAVADLGARHGYTFTSSDALMARRVLQDLAARTSGAVDDESDELEDHQLGAIAGGVSAAVAAVTTGLGELPQRAWALLSSW